MFLWWVINFPGVPMLELEHRVSVLYSCRSISLYSKIPLRNFLLLEYRSIEMRKSKIELLLGGSEGLITY